MEPDKSFSSGNGVSTHNGPSGTQDKGNPLTIFNLPPDMRPPHWWHVV